MEKEITEESTGGVIIKDGKVVVVSQARTQT